MAALAAFAAWAAGWPDWVLDPAAAGELAGADCVIASGQFPIDRAQVTAKARLVLAQQIEVRVEAMDETMDSRVREGKAERFAVSFKSASRQLVNTTLQGSRLVRTQVVKRPDGEYLCGLVAIDKPKAQDLPRDIIRTAGKVDEDTEAVLLTRFRQVAAARAAAPPGAKP
jgi:hypothetical protein